MSDAQEILSALDALAPVLVDGAGTIKELERLSGGASQETWAFTVRESLGRAHAFILRRAPGGGPVEPGMGTAIGLANEAHLIRAAVACGVPAPGVAHVCGPEDGLGQAFIMDRVEGETIAPRILRRDDLGPARARLATQCGAALARIHGIDPAGLPDLALRQGPAQIDQYEEIYRAFEAPRPVFDLAIQWLRAHAPAPLAPVLVHGDFRLGNLMVERDGLVAVLDWELAHIGDPREDIAWMCVNSWRFGQSENRVGGFGDLGDLLDAYEAAGGAAISPGDIDWWEMLGSFKWGVMCMTMYEAFRSGSDPSVERAAIGRRASETEIDLVNLLKKVSRNA